MRHSMSLVDLIGGLVSASYQRKETLVRYQTKSSGRHLTGTISLRFLSRMVWYQSSY